VYMAALLLLAFLALCVALVQLLLVVLPGLREHQVALYRLTMVLLLSVTMRVLVTPVTCLACGVDHEIFFAT